eukprot:1903387-Lingulodinium_polyedra.AAC.1
MHELAPPQRVRPAHGQHPEPRPEPRTRPNLGALAGLQAHEARGDRGQAERPPEVRGQFHE